jgi:hypothetical protein
MRTILLAIALMVLTHAAHAAGPAPNTVGCKPNTAQIDGHNVFTACAPGTDTVISETWHKDGKPDRAEGPARIMRDAATGIVTYEAWYRDGKKDRADGPAYIERDAATGKITHEEWWKDDKQIAPPIAAVKHN